MFTVKMKDMSIKRFLQPLYANTQATPVSVVLDAADTSAFLPGYAMSLGTPSMTGVVGAGTIPESYYSGANATVTVCKTATQVPFGLSAHFADPSITDEVRDSGTNTMAVWVGGNDAQFKAIRTKATGVGAFTATAVELAAAAADLTAGKDVFMAPSATGQLTFADTNTPAAHKFIKLVDIISDFEIVIRFA